MKERTFSPFAALCLFLVTCICLVGTHFYRAQFIHINDNRYLLEIVELDLSGRPVTDWESLASLPNLRKLDLRQTGLTATEYQKIQGLLPDVEILWDIPFQGQFYPMSTHTLHITDLSAEDRALLDYFPGLKCVYCSQCNDLEQLDLVRREHPDLMLDYLIPVGEERFPHTATELTLTNVDPDALMENLPYFHALESILLISPDATGPELLAFQQANPHLNITWQIPFHGITVDDTTTTLDLTGLPVTVEEMEALIPYLPNLTYVDMSDCGIPNEEMDALNRRYEDIKIVWTVTLGSWYRTKTDITWFMPVKYGFYPSGNALYNLRYCTDVIAVDIGHRKVTNCDWAAFMPHLQYLLIADTYITDLTPLTGLTELKYLEIFLSPIRDYSPLVTCTGLEDLNLCYTWGDPNVIAQITWLKNLWWDGGNENRIGWDMMQYLRECIPGCNFNFFSGSSTGGGWRELPNYYAQRDIFGMWYMTG